MFLIFVVFVKAQQWPDCIVDEVDYTGDDIISGLRFSSEECALWCQRVIDI